MSTFKDKCEQYFGTSDFYEILQLNRDATEKQIKKAYYKLSLLVHPDRVDENQKEVATEKFKVLGKIHLILQNQNSRSIYDECGDFDEETDATFNWMEYWLSKFKKIELADIQKYEKEYVGSDTEKRDIKRAYESSKGNMDRILEMVPFSNCDNEPRIIEIVKDMVDKGEVVEYEAFFNESKAKRARRKRKYEAEKKEVEKIDMKKFEEEMEAASKARMEQFSNLIANIEAKYGPKKSRKSLTDGSKASPAKKIRKSAKK